VVTLLRRGRIWWIQYRQDGLRVRESLKTRNRKVAEELRLRREVEVGQRRLGLAPPVVAAAPPPPKLVEAVTDAGRTPLPAAPGTEEVRCEYAAWSKAYKRPKTIVNDQARLVAFFATVPGRTLPDLRTADVERFLTREAAKGRSPATLLRHREILHAFWRWAVRQGYAESNIVGPIPRPRLPERDPVFLSLEQVDDLLAAVSGLGIEAAVATAMFAGLRREELCWLCWSDLELDREPGILRVRAKTMDGVSWQPKTKRDRKVPISTRLAVVLQRHRAKGRRSGVPWLFASPEGCRWDPDNLGRAFREAMQRAGQPWNLLQLRHTFGSQLARKGVSLLKIAKLMGNSPAIAAKHYINLVPEEMADDVAF